MEKPAKTLLIERTNEQYVASDEIYLRGLASNTKLTVLYYFLIFITGGLFYAFSRFKPFMTAKVKHTEAPLEAADHVLIRRQEEGTWIYSISKMYTDSKRNRFFDYMCVRFIYEDDTGEFQKVEYEIEKKFSTIHAEHSQGHDHETANENLALYRSNVIEVPMDSYAKLFVSEVLHPFYLFQVFSIAVWLWDDYYAYAICIFIMATVSSIISVYQARKNRQKLREMVRTITDVTIIRDGQPTRLRSSDIVPGDLVVVEPNTPVPCDMIVLSGSIVVNESSLTGESIPVLKSPLPNDDQETFNSEHSTKYILFNGTNVLQTRTLPDQPAIAVAYSTGFSTLKGELIRSIMFPKPTKFKFYRDSMRFVGVLALFGKLSTPRSIISHRLSIALCGFVYTVAMFSYFGATWDVIVVRALDLVTITVPPALPVAMTIGTAFAISRLKTQDIYCISPSRVNVSGRIDTMCFDKTGTLTEEGLSVFGAQPMEENTFGELIPELQKAPVPLLHILASCHSLSVLNGQLIGDPLDVKMFEATRWTIHEPDNRVVVRSSLGQEIQIVRAFEFSSLLQRMSVIAKVNDEYYLFAKGSPEMMKTLSIKQTLPRSFDEVLVSHTHQGKRVLGLAMKPLPGLTDYDAAKISRQEAESDLTFQGLLILQNQLKEDTADVIRLLQAGAVSNIMVTGDNEFTAISVARQCHIIKPDESVFLITLRDKDDENNNDNRGQGLVELYDRSALKFEYVPKYGEAYREAPFSWSDPGVALAINGKAFQHLQQNDVGLLKTVLHKAVVYSRMSPLHKAELVVGLQDLGLTVGMCGDGANDCGALKAADVGLSLSDAEASVAAPFTSKQPTIRSLFTLLREGRCALISSIQVYKYMACYSLLQGISIWILYSVNYDSRLRDSQFLWIDMGLIFPLSFLMGRTEPRRSLSKHRPSSSLLSSTILVSIVLQILIHCAFQVVMFIATNLYYIPEYHAGIPFTDAESIKITVIFLFANFQYISTVVAYSINKPFRRGLHTNFPFFISILILTLLCIYLLIWPDSWTAWLFNISEIKLGFRFVILAAAAVNFGIVYALEYMFIVSYMQNSESERQLVRLRKLRQNDRSIELQSMKV